MDPHVKSGRIPSSTSNSAAALILITLRVLVFLVLFRHSLRPSLPSSSIVPGRNLDGSSVTVILQQTDVVLLPLLAAVKEATGVANPLRDSVFGFLLRYMKKKALYTWFFIKASALYFATPTTTPAKPSAWVPAPPACIPQDTKPGRTGARASLAT